MHYASWRVARARLSIVLIAVTFVFLANLRSDYSSAQEVPPSPIDPESGEQNLLDLIESLPINDVQTALDHFPVPYVVCASAGGASPTCVNQRAGSPQRLDADQSKATGKGGDDIQVEVNTELLPTPHLRVNINRITSPSDATDVAVLVAFPFAGFNDEPTLPAPNLFLGYQTTAANGAVGGKAPLTEEFRVIPDILAGTSHDFTLQMLTTGQVNPMVFQAGHFDGTTGSGIQNAIGIQAYVEGTAPNPVVPNSIALTLSTGENGIGVPLTDTELSLNWTASSAAKVTFNYIEHEDFPLPSVLDYTTSLTFDEMPTSETISLSLDEAAGELHLTHSANAVIDTITLEHTRSDGLTIVGTATDVPTSVDLALDLNGGSLTLDVNANTLDLSVSATQDGGFFDTADFLGYNIGYAEVFLVDAPDLFAGYDPVANSFGVQATNPGEFIGAIGLIIGDDDDLELPLHWGDQTWHEFSLIDDGTHGTAAARIIDLGNATLTLDASPTGETFTFELGSRSRMELHLETGPASALTGEDILARCEIDSMPMGDDVDFTIDFPDQFEVDASPDHTQVIDSITCAGHVGTLNFELGVGHLPMNSGYKYDANGRLEVKVEPAGPNSDYIGFITVRLWDETNPLPSPFVLPALFGSAPLHDTRMRADHIPSFIGTWSDSPATVISFDTGNPDASLFLGGIQVNVSSEVGLPALSPAVAGSHHYLRFTDGGPGEAVTLGAGAFGIDEISYSSTEATHALEMHYKADAAHILDVTFDTRFGGSFFPEFDLDLVLTANAIPATWDLTTNFSTSLDYTASAGLSSITLIGDLMAKELVGDGVNATFTGNTLHDSDSPFAGSWGGGIVYAGTNTANVASNVADELALDAWTPAVPAAATPYFIASKTHIDFLASGLPSHIAYALDASDEGGATLTMSNPITLVRLELTSDLKIFSQPYKHMLFEINDIPADWTAEWGLAPNPHASLSTSSPLGAVKVVLSKDTLANEAAQYAPFTNAGGSVQYSAFTREIDRRYLRQGQGDNNVREAVFMGILDSLFNSTSSLGAGEDHFIMRKDGAGKMSFLSVQGTGFQCAAVQLGPGSLQCGAPQAVNAGEINASLLINFAGDHPFYVGMEDEPNKFLTVDVPNIPDTTSVIIGPSRAHLDFDTSAGTITVYKGALPGTNDGGEVTKMQFVNTPTFVHANWDLGFPGGVNVDTSNPMQFRLLSQSGNDRTVAVFEVGDLSASWGIDAVTNDEQCTIDLPPECGLFVQFAKVFFNLSASPAIDGLVLTYNRISNAQNLSVESPPNSGTEYVPRVSFFLDGFVEFEASAQIEICYFGICAIGVPLPDVDIDIALSGGFTLDFWDLGSDDADFLGILGDHDYINNNPWHLLSGLLHDPSSHVFPFEP